jgi:hypothetical protein
VPGTSGSTSTAVLASCSSARISPEYDVRRQSVSSVRMKRRASSSPGDARASSGGAAPGIAVSSASAPASCQAVSAASASTSVGTGTRSGTEASPCVRPNSNRLRPEWAAFWLGPHQVTTCDWARVSAT